jgi:uncharacterized protein (TIGR00255 family)
VKSMTGFGTANVKAKTANIEVTIKAVNGRFLEIRMRLPKEYSHLENEAKKLIGKSIQRGSVDVFINRKVNKTESSGEINVNLPMAKKWSQAYKKLAKEVGYKGELPFHLIVAAPEVLVFEEPQKIAADEEKSFLSCISKAVQACDKERSREGAFLIKELEGTLNGLEKDVSRVIQLREHANKELFDRYSLRLEKLTQDRGLDEQRLAQEVVIQVDKSDINEEVTRLMEHIKMFRGLLASGESHGKKLDFYTQELLREMNTIGSKAQHAEITHSVVNGKSLIERLREQVQNVE